MVQSRIGDKRINPEQADQKNACNKMVLTVMSVVLGVDHEGITEMRP